MSNADYQITHQIFFEALFLMGLVPDENIVKESEVL
jgi:hypothetical protein